MAVREAQDEAPIRPHFAFTHEIGQRAECLVVVGGRVEAVL